MTHEVPMDDNGNQSFPDRFAVDVIREALWRGPPNTRACVMIGAGFSRNADPVSSSARRFPAWSDMAAALSDSLYPLEEPRWRDQARKDASATSGFLRLAQEYETAFGRLALNERIRSLVPDHDYQPGALHRRLLTLPWGDIFTTNWDTLLERAGRDVFSRNYDTVHTYAEIPGAQRPRIVHLHGSFPAYDPFVFTEEDFRRYPITHAPFVNLVQQALMESTLCLLGFSGDDPNFLHWSGWVRDNLGPHSPKIFLIGWLNLSPHRRRMLENRNVVPVDLAMLPGVGRWPSDVKHKHALRWLLTELECPPVHNPLHWPKGRESYRNDSSELCVLTRAAMSGRTEAKESYSLLTRLRKTWQGERDLYPDWFVAPKRARDEIWRNTEPHLPFLLRMLKISGDETIAGVFREACWRLNVALASSESFESGCHTLLRTIGFFTANGESTCDFGARGKELLESAQHIALFVLRSSVREGDRASFLETRDRLSYFPYRPQDVSNELIYACALWHRDHAEFPQLEQCLYGWNVELADHGWSIRKAGLMSYLGWQRSSRRLGSATIRNIRQYRRRDIVDLAAFSREAWALWHMPPPSGEKGGRRTRAPTELGRVQRAVIEDDESSDEWANDASARWRELAMYDCNPLAECAELLATLYGERVRRSAEARAQEANDECEAGINEEARQRRRVGEMLRLADEISLGCVNGQSKAFEVALRASIVESASKMTYLSSVYAIRLASDADDPMLEQVFSPTRVGNLKPAMREQLKQILEAEQTFVRNCEPSRYLGTVSCPVRLIIIDKVLKALGTQMSATQSEQTTHDGE